MKNEKYVSHGLISGDKIFCKRTVRQVKGNILFQEGVMYKFDCLMVTNLGQIKCQVFPKTVIKPKESFVNCYVLDRLDNGDREFFYDVEKFDKHFVTEKELRKQKLKKLNKI